MTKSNDDRPTISNPGMPRDIMDVFLMANGGIERQEAQGAWEMAAQTSQLPTQRLNERFCASDRTCPNGDKTIAEMSGVKVLGKVDGDAIFSKVELPAGWKIVRTDHSMWTQLLDAGGGLRAMMFYKAAFYDRGANIQWHQRFKIEEQRSADGKEWEPYAKNATQVRFAVIDCGQTTEVKRDGETTREGTTIFLTPTFTFSEERYSDETEREEQARRGVALAWLVERFPRWEDPAAHWGEAITP